MPQNQNQIFQTCDLKNSFHSKQVFPLENQFSINSSNPSLLINNLSKYHLIISETNLKNIHLNFLIIQVFF